MRSDLTAGDLACATSTVSVPGTVILKNVGTTPLTSATIYYRVDNGSWSNQAWTGNLAPNATANVSVTFPGVPTGNHILNDSIFVASDLNMGNSLSGKLVTVINSTPNALPISDSFSGTLNANWINKDLNQNAGTWQLVSSPSGNGHTVSYYMRHLNTSIPAGDTNLLILPAPNLTAGQKALDFWYGYRRWNASSTDQMDVLYSSNCGQTWTALWSKSGANLATIGDSSGYWQINRYQWVFKSLDMTAVPAGSIVAFRAISKGGNNLYLDDVNMRAGTPSGIEDIVNSGLFQLYPNPAKDKVSLSFVTSEKANISVEIIDVLGHVVSSSVNMLPAGAQKIELSTENLAQGIYNVKIGTDKGYHIERLTVVK